MTFTCLSLLGREVTHCQVHQGRSVVLGRTVTSLSSSRGWAWSKVTCTVCDGSCSMSTWLGYGAPRQLGKHFWLHL